MGEWVSKNYKPSMSLFSPRWHRGHCTKRMPTVRMLEEINSTSGEFLEAKNGTACILGVVKPTRGTGYIIIERDVGHW